MLPSPDLAEKWDSFRFDDAILCRDMSQDTHPIPDAPPATEAPPAWLVQALRDAGLADPTAGYTPLSGGRTNHCWRFGDRVCKLYSGSGTPLFPNDARAEARALRHLGGTGLAPDLVTLLQRPEGCAIVYGHVPGAHWHQGTGQVGVLMAQLHDQPAPEVRELRQGPCAILNQAERMLETCRGTKVEQLRRLRPSPPDLPPVAPVFLHADIVARNLIEAPGGLRLIDWQCPATGDPTEDIAIFLSPAMQLVYRGQDLTKQDSADFFAGYASPARQARYDSLAPLFHWRMAAYCLWKVEQGDADYAPGLTAELRHLEQLAHP